MQGVKEWLKQHALSLRGRCGPGYVSKYAAFSRARYLFLLFMHGLQLRIAPTFLTYY